MDNKIKHLEMIEAIIERMANNSFLLKGWAITLVVALFALADKQYEQRYILIAFLPIIFFWFLDSYYLSLEKKYRELYGDNPYAMISGFHMRKKSDYTDEDIAVMEETARELCNTDTVFYTGHCTGEYPFEVMKKILGEQLVYVHSGEEIVCVD